MAEGWITLHRKIQDNSLWKSEKFTRGQAWVDLILLANHKRGFIYVRGNKITVERGQVGWSQRRLAERWKWSRTKVKKFLNDIEEEDQIEPQKNNITTVITLKNYNQYQYKEPQKSHRSATEVPQKDTNNNVNNVNNVNKRTLLSGLTADEFKQMKTDEDKINWITVRTHELVRQRYGHHKSVRTATLESWREPIRLMHSADGLDFQTIGQYLVFSMKDEFWKDTVKSTSGLRKNWEEIDAAMKRKQNHKHKKAKQPSMRANADAYKYYTGEDDAEG